MSEHTPGERSDIVRRLDYASIAFARAPVLLRSLCIEASAEVVALRSALQQAREALTEARDELTRADTTSQHPWLAVLRVRDALSSALAAGSGVPQQTEEA